MLNKFLRQIDVPHTNTRFWKVVHREAHIRRFDGRVIIERKFVSCLNDVAWNGKKQASGSFFAQSQSDVDEELFEKFNSLMRDYVNDESVTRRTRPLPHEDRMDVFLRPNTAVFAELERRILRSESYAKEVECSANLLISSTGTHFPRHQDYVLYRGRLWSLHADLTNPEIEKLLDSQLRFEYDQLQSLIARSNDANRSRRPVAEAVRSEVWRRDGGKCVKCGSRDRLEFDHIIPFALGGGDTARNIELLCEPCNRAKGARI